MRRTLRFVGPEQQEEDSPSMLSLQRAQIWVFKGLLSVSPIEIRTVSSCSRRHRETPCASAKAVWWVPGPPLDRYRYVLTSVPLALVTHPSLDMSLCFISITEDLQVTDGAFRQLSCDHNLQRFTVGRRSSCLVYSLLLK
jgi:hypothetical protein